MTGRFHESWGDFGGLRTEASLEYDCINGIANCMRSTIGDHFHPRGDINYPMFDLIKNIYGRLQKLEPWIEGAKPVVDVGVVAPEFSFSPSHKLVSRGQISLKGASRMLCELKCQFDVLSSAQDISRYKLIILPDHVALKGELLDRIREYIAKGGAVISSAWSGLDENGFDFALKEWGIKFNGESPHDPAYISVSDERMAKDFPQMPVTLYEKGTDIEANNGSEILAEIVEPYYNRHFDGEHAFMYLPPNKKTGKAALCRNKNIAHFSHPLFLNYNKHAQPQLKTLFKNLIGDMLEEPVVKIDNLPSFGRATVTEQTGRRMVYIMSYVPEKRGEKTEMIEEPIKLNGVKISLRCDDRKVKSVYMAPDKKPLEFEEKDGRLETGPFSIDNGYAVIVFEE
jgi:hypothetical protein